MLTTIVFTDLRLLLVNKKYFNFFIQASWIKPSDVFWFITNSEMPFRHLEGLNGSEIDPPQRLSLRSPE